MSIRTYDNGSFYSVSVGEDEIRRFRSRWPASGLSGLRNVWAQFDRRNGDLVDLQCNRRSCHRFDGASLKALVDDMQCLATRKGMKSKAPKDHCRPSGDDWKRLANATAFGALRYRRKTKR